MNSGSKLLNFTRSTSFPQLPFHQEFAHPFGGGGDDRESCCHCLQNHIRAPSQWGECTSRSAASLIRLDIIAKSEEQDLLTQIFLVDASFQVSS
ncbi:MAG: hypothetical protein R3C11_05640 [Planctomycetaceae bacterium]